MKLNIPEILLTDDENFLINLHELVEPFIVSRDILSNFVFTVSADILEKTGKIKIDRIYEYGFVLFFLEPSILDHVVKFINENATDRFSLPSQ